MKFHLSGSHAEYHSSLKLLVIRQEENGSLGAQTAAVFRAFGRRPAHIRSGCDNRQH